MINFNEIDNLSDNDIKEIIQRQEVKDTPFEKYFNNQEEANSFFTNHKTAKEIKEIIFSWAKK